MKKKYQSYKKPRILFSSVFKPFGIKDKYAEGLGMQMELFNNQISRLQGVHSLRQTYFSYSLYFLAENISAASTVLDFPNWNEFKKKLKNGYTHVAISFVVANVLKVKRMTEYIRRRYPEIIIILGGYGTLIPDLDKILPYDELCIGEGILWFKKYLGEPLNTPLKHPVIQDPIEQYLYGYRSIPKAALVLTRVGCDNRCDFCSTSHNFGPNNLPFLKTGKDIFHHCQKSEKEIGAKTFSILDANFMKECQKAKELLTELEKHKKTYMFSIFSSAETLDKVDANFLIRLGVKMIWIGAESQESAYLKTKGIDFKSLVEKFQSKGISVIISIMLFQKHHTPKKLIEDIDWSIQLKSDFVQYLNLTAFPGTTLYKNLKKNKTLKNISYRYYHGQGELNFYHPYINDPVKHETFLKEACQKKYLIDGPGVINIALTLMRGYTDAKNNFAKREKEGKIWSLKTFSYEKTNQLKSDEFMKLRIEQMHQTLQRFRPIFLSALFFAPNAHSREKIHATMKLWQEKFGKPSLKIQLKSLALLLLATVESLKIFYNKIKGRETIIRQPPCFKKEYK